MTYTLPDGTIILVDDITLHEEQILNDFVIEQMKKIGIINNCKLHKQEILMTSATLMSNSVTGVVSKIHVIWSCLACNKFYENDDLSDLNEIKCLEDCMNPNRKRHWESYLGIDLKKDELKKKKKTARNWINSLNDQDLIKAITELLGKESAKPLSLGERRILTLLLTEDKKRSRRQILCQP